MNFLEEYRDKVAQEIRQYVAKGSTPLLDLHRISAYHLGLCDEQGNLLEGTAGKYLRPLFCLGICAGLGGDADQALPAAACLELTHRCTLIFDDIQDHGTERNNRPAAWKVWGVNQAINAGLDLSSIARLSMHRLIYRRVPAGIVLEAWRELELTVRELCRGQNRDVSLGDAVNIDVADYLDMIRGKTATLFGTACWMGAWLAHISREVQSRAENPCGPARELGLALGMAFQIHDDYLGIWGDPAVVGKTANDLIEKKRSLPVVLAMKAFPEKTATFLNIAEVTLADGLLMKQALEEYDIPDMVRDWEDRYLDDARRALQKLALRTEMADQFESVISFLADRTL